jgi:hypothetical protein
MMDEMWAQVTSHDFEDWKYCRKYLDAIPVSEKWMYEPASDDHGSSFSNKISVGMFTILICVNMGSIVIRVQKKCEPPNLVYIMSFEKFDSNKCSRVINALKVDPTLDMAALK